MTVKITSGQRKQISRFLQDGLEHLDLTKEDAQLIIMQGGVLQTELKETIAILLKNRKFPSLLSTAGDIIPRGWEVVEDVAPSKFEVKDLELISFLENGEEWIGTKEMYKRAVDLNANLGLVDAKYVLEHQGEISAEFRKRSLLFTGTKALDLQGILCFPFLYWSGNHWVFHFGWGEIKWGDHYSLVRINK
ncbi:MAG: hypothetical protein G01um101413_870 [Parcubacteria group bacterium Gr01-1014_13]|nr:MAG: hypothetical protein G01um101413_870 [Parcubacteria group bacterium Gr01-1014_13]